jgi:hypothetical protein
MPDVRGLALDAVERRKLTAFPVAFRRRARENVLGGGKRRN